MSEQWQIRKGTNTENISFTGALGEITMDTDRKELRLHDGSTVGGKVLGRDYMTNCITEIPQDIKLELNNGTLTLKAGSKVYLANGTQNDSYITTVDITSTWTYNGSAMAILTNTNALFIAPIENCLSGTIANRPSTLPTTTGNGLYYATDENKIYLTGDRGATWYSGNYYSFPIAIMTTSNSAISSIDQVFNGFGYIGSTVFALPGVKGLIPDGRNEDGSLKNIELRISSVQTATNPDATNTDKIITINDSGAVNQSNEWIVSKTRPTFREEWNQCWYNPDTNKVFFYRSATNNGFRQIALAISFSVGDDTRITGFTPKTAFRALDYNDYQESKDNVANQIAALLQTIYPVGSVYIGTQSACPMATLISNSTWELVSNGRALWTGNGTNGNTTIAAGLPNITGSFGVDRVTISSVSKAFTNSTASGSLHGGGGASGNYKNTISFSAAHSSSVYGNSDTVQPPAYVVNVWRRTA